MSWAGFFFGDSRGVAVHQRWGVVCERLRPLPMHWRTFTERRS